jgi:hypothetical protein
LLWCFALSPITGCFASCLQLPETLPTVLLQAYGVRLIRHFSL